MDDATRKKEFDLRLEGARKVLDWLNARTFDPSITMSMGEFVEMLRIDMDHSSLLMWLCCGNDPLPFPPPVCMSRPNHHAAYEGRFEPYKVWVCSWPMYEEQLIVDQTAWNIVEKIDDAEWIATYKPWYDRDVVSVPWRIKKVGEYDQFQDVEWSGQGPRPVRMITKWEATRLIEQPAYER